MGYYTQYELETIGNHEYPISDIAKYMLQKNKADGDSFYPFENQIKDRYIIDDTVEDLYMDPYDECKWYKHDTEMLDLSKKFSNVIFKLHGDGEETGDIWDTYYKNGKMQHCQAEMIIPPYDESKLQ